MYLTGWPWMPPLSFTQSKYALATLPIVVKSTPGISMSMPPILIGEPVAFLPVPRPQTDFVADAVPEPTGADAAVLAPVAQLATISARPAAAAHATPILIFLDRMCSYPSFASRIRRTERRGRQQPRPRDQDLVKSRPPPSDASPGRAISEVALVCLRAAAYAVGGRPGLCASAATSRILDHCLAEWNAASLNPRPPRRPRPRAAASRPPARRRARCPRLSTRSRTAA